MGQQHSTLGDNAVAATTAERKMRGDNVEAGHGHLSPVWKKSVSAVVTSLPSHGELISGDSSSSHRSKMDGEVSRMSIRAAIDSFIENCLSTPTDEAAADKPNIDSSFDGESKQIHESSSPKTPNSSTEDDDTAQPGVLSVEDRPTSSLKDTEDAESNTVKKDELMICDEKTSVKDSGKPALDKCKDDSSDSDSCKSREGIQEEEVKEKCGDEKVNKTEKDGVKDNLAKASNTSLEKQIQTPLRSEKQSFSAFLQDRLNRDDFDKHEELAQLALSKDIKCQEQMIMWEAVRKPSTPSESSGASFESDGLLLTAGPVRLQTLIDRVLDSSLNNRNSGTIVGRSLGLQVASAVQLENDKATTQPNPSRGSPSNQYSWFSSSEKKPSHCTEKGTSASIDKTLSFKSHIEKVLLERFLSYEEDERKEALKTVNMGNGPSVKTSSDSQTGITERTISVQDLVDQVISQTDINNRNSPRDSNKPASYLAQPDKAKSGVASDNEPNPKPNVHSVSPQSTALIEAQRHMVQKELQSSTSLGRKRGRPQLNATGSSSHPVSELTKDPNMAHFNERVQERKSSYRMSPLKYASKGSLQYGVSVNMNPLASNSLAAASATPVLQNRHYVAQNPKDLPSSLRASLPSVSLDYRLLTQETFHQQPESQHSSSETYQSLSRTHDGGFLPSSKAPPPLILADQVSSSQINQVMAVPHAPMKSCSCHLCLNHFSQGQNHPVIAQHQIHRQVTTQEKAANPATHPSSFNSYQPHLKNFKDTFSKHASTVSEAVRPVLTAPIQGLPLVVITTQENLQHSLPISRELLSGQHVDSNPLSGHHHRTNPDSVTLLDPKYPDAHYLVPKPRIRLDTHGSDIRRLTENRNPHPGRAEAVKAEAAAGYTQTGTYCEQPLDLSVKPHSVGKQEKMPSNLGTDSTRQDIWDQDRISPYRQSFLDKPLGSKSQCVVNEQGLPSGHHLQRLEKSVDNILPHGHPHRNDPGYVQPKHLPLPGGKTGSHHTAQEILPCSRGGGQHDLTLAESRSLPPERHDSKTSHRLSHSPVVYSQVMIDSLPPHQQQQQQQPALAAPHNSRKSAPSPSCWTRQITSPSLGHVPSDVNENQFEFTGTASPLAQHRPASLGPEVKQKVLPGSPAAFVSALAHPQKSPSPEDGDGQNFSISKHEPIQNIIGSHSPSDILYLICRLCRQTYGSPYGFRKHFRNQHGFEPKADHTIVQTISATKTAMAHTEPALSSEERGIYPPSTQEKLMDNSQCSESQSENNATNLSSLIQNPQLAEDSKLDIKKNMDTKYLECPECGQTFQLNDFGSYKRHCRQHNLHRSYGPFACRDCHKSFAEPQQLREHLLTHSSSTHSVCGICQTFFSSPDYLAEHIQETHGHSLSSEEGVRSSPHSGGSESSRLEDHPHTFEHLPLHGYPSSSPVKAAGSLSCQPGTLSVSSNSVSPPSTKFAAVPPPAPQELRRSSSSSSHHLPTSKHHHCNRSSLADSHMFVVHTPKDLEVEKLPADGVVTTASPDSSFDDSKFLLDSQPASSTSERSPRPTEAAAANGSEAINRDHQEQSNISSLCLGKASAGNSSDNENKKSTITSPPKTQESSDSFNSKSFSVNASHSSSEESNTFYRHKKYGRHWKRHSTDDGDGEPSTKSPKVEGASLVHRQSPYSVSSSINYGVTVQDCQSSSPNLEEPSTVLNKPHEKEKKDFESQKAENQSYHKPDSKQKNDKAERSSDLKKDISRQGHSPGTANVADGAAMLKWDRQTRSQAGKSSNMVTHVP